MGDAADDAYRRAEQELEDGDDHGRSHCMVCGERFMGDEVAEVVSKTELYSKRHLIIHQSCYDENRHEVV